MARVIILTDDKMIGSGVESILKENGYEIELTDGWADFAALTHKMNPDVILMDAVFDYSILLPTIKKFYAYLPIVLFSRMLSAEEISTRASKIGTTYWSSCEGFPRTLLLEIERALKDKRA